MTVQVAIFGAGGRMGEALLRFYQAVEGVKVVVGIVKPEDLLIGQDASRIIGGPMLNIPLLGHLDSLIDGSYPDLPKVDAIIDFSRPELTLMVAHWCKVHKMALVSGTTGFSVEQKHMLEQLALTIPILQSNNMSPGVNLCFDLVKDTARRLGDHVDVEIVESHHKYKIDAPSGTALRLGEAVAEAWGVDLASRAVYSREGCTGQRIPGSIGFATIRAADIVGEHTVIFASEGERIEITHKSSSRVHYAKGSLLAALWLVNRPAALYSMTEVFKTTE